MKINNLIVTQNGLRNLEQVKSMIYFVRDDGIFDRHVIKNKLIAINVFEDGKHYIHDGHHRVAAVYLSGKRDHLYQEEYFITHLPYIRYIEANFDNNWYTPFDPRTHLRLLDFFDFKNNVIALANDCREKAIEYIAANSSEYLVPRSNIYHIKEILANKH